MAIKKTVLAVALSATASLSPAECLDHQWETSVLQVGNVYEFCFESEITQTKHASNAFQIIPEQIEQVPKNYQRSGIKGVVSVVPLKENVKGNVIIDFKNGDREEISFISTHNTVTKNTIESIGGKQ